MEPTQEVMLRLPAGEIDEIVVLLQRSIRSSQLLISKIVLQAQAQEPEQPPAQEPERAPPPPPNGEARRSAKSAA